MGLEIRQIGCAFWHASSTAALVMWPPTRSPGKSHCLGLFTGHQRRRICSNFGESMTSRSFCPFPSSTRMTIRWLTIERVLHHANRLCPCLDGRSDLGSAARRVETRQMSPHVRRARQRQEHRPARVGRLPEDSAQGPYLGGVATRPVVPTTTPPASL